MKRALVSIGFISAALAVSPAWGAERSGKELFDHYCGSCHLDGGNTIRPQKSLHRLDREADGIRKPKDVVARMRKPAGPQMPRFDKSYISDEEAMKIGEYVVGVIK